MEIRTDFTALVLPTASDLQRATERARLVAGDAERTPRRSFRLPFFGRRREARPATRHAVAR